MQGIEVMLYEMSYISMIFHNTYRGNYYTRDTCYFTTTVRETNIQPLRLFLPDIGKDCLNLENSSHGYTCVGYADISTEN